MPMVTLLDLSSVLDQKGVLQQGAELTCNNGTARIEIAQGTKAFTNEGAPLGTIQVQPISDIPLPPADCHIIGLAYDFGPEGATFDPPLSITLEYDPALCPEGVAEENLVIAYYDVETGKWVECECEVDIVNHIIIAHVSHFTLFAILAEAAPLTPPLPLPTQISWSLIGGIIGAAVVVIGIGTYVIMRRRKPIPES